MYINPQIYIPRERKEPPPEEIEEKKMHYVRRLAYYGYQCRDEESFIELAEYFAKMALGVRHEKYPDLPKYDLPKKGLLLLGPVGSGKTMALQIFAGIFHIEFLYADSLVQEYAMRGEIAFWDLVRSYDGRPVVVDDIGIERDLKSFGNDPVMIEFFYHRERLFKNLGIHTHYNSNLKSREEIKERYNSQVASRIMGMCDTIKIIASDGRMEEK